jgi:polyhydroxybutyrate depolymerase
VKLTLRALAAVALAAALLPVPRASAFPGPDVAAELNFGQLQRTYLLHLPVGVDHPAGLVLNLHGAGMTDGAQSAATNYNAAADRFGFVVVYPDGIDASWADGRGASVPDRNGIDDVGFLVTLAAQLVSEHGIPPGRVFATGMSAGGFMAARLGCERADIFSAIAPVAATLGSSVGCRPSRPISVLQVNGTADTVVPFNGGPMVGRGGASDIVSAPVMAQRWRDWNRCPPAVDTPTPGAQLSTAAGCAGNTEVQFVQVIGGGHTWPGDTSNVSAQFFADHGR